MSYAPEQGWLLPPRIDAVLGPDHLAVFVHELIEKLDLSGFDEEYGEDGRPAYPPQMMLKIWFYAYARGQTSSRRIEQLVREELGFRYLAGGLEPDFWTLNQFRRRHPRRLNDVFTLVVEAAREMGMVKLGRVAIDSTRIEANASEDRSDSMEGLRRERARLRQRIRRWQKRCEAADQALDEEQLQQIENWKQRLDEIPKQLEELKKSGQKRSSRTDPQSRYMRKRKGYCLGYTGELAVSDDHVIVAGRVHQKRTDNSSLSEMAELVKTQSGAQPKAVVGDSGYHSMDEIEKVEKQGVGAYVPDAVLAKELAGGEAVEMNARQQRRHPGLAERRERLRGPTAREHQRRRKAIVEPVFGVLKQQRGMGKFRRRGLAAVEVEWIMAAIAYNMTRMWAKANEKEGE